ncbi:unnamed protein product [Lampetra planeri]
MARLPKAAEPLVATATRAAMPGAVEEPERVLHTGSIPVFSRMGWREMERRSRFPAVLNNAHGVLYEKKKKNNHRHHHHHNDDRDTLMMSSAARLAAGVVAGLTPLTIPHGRSSVRFVRSVRTAVKCSSSH